MLETTQQISNFKDIQVYEDFYAFFDAKFQVISEKQLYNETVKVYQVSKNEKLGVQVSTDSDPDPLKECNYSFILFPKKDDSLDHIRIYGTLIKKEGSLQLNTSEPLDRLRTNKNLINLMDSLSYVDQSVNPHFILFPLNKKHKFIYGDLKRWERTPDGKLHIIGNLANKMKRIRQWQQKNPPKKPIKYSLAECIKSKCSHHKNNACEYAMTPNNKSENSVKLLNAKGYCYDYNPKSFEKLKSKLNSIFTRMKNDYQTKYQNAIELLENTPETIFDHNVMAKSFDKRKFSALNYLLYEIKPDLKRKTLENAKKQIKLNEIENNFNQIIILGEDLFFRIGTKKGFIKAKKEFENIRDNTIYFLNDKINEIERRRLHNRCCFIIRSKMRERGFSSLRII